jgi:hypothetical protein
MSKAGPAPHVLDLAEACARAIEQAVGVAPDYTSDTLPLLDHYVEMIPERAAGAVLDLIVPAVGAYFGEVVRRELGGARWVAPDEDYKAYRLQFEHCFLQFNPIGVALEVIHQDDVPGWSAHYRVHPTERTAVRAAIGRLGSVSVDDYYRFAVRFDVVQAIHAGLEHRGEIVLLPADYAAAIPDEREPEA